MYKNLKITLSPVVNVISNVFDKRHDITKYSQIVI